MRTAERPQHALAPRSAEPQASLAHLQRCTMSDKEQQAHLRAEVSEGEGPKQQAVGHRSRARRATCRATARLLPGAPLLVGCTN